MRETEFDERFDDIEKPINNGFAHITGLLDSLASLCAREFISISEDFAQVDKRLHDLEGKLRATVWTPKPRNGTSSPNAFRSLSGPNSA